MTRRSTIGEVCVCVCLCVCVQLKVGSYTFTVGYLKYEVTWFDSDQNRNYVILSPGQAAANFSATIRPYTVSSTDYCLLFVNDELQCN